MPRTPDTVSSLDEVQLSVYSGLAERAARAKTEGRVPEVYAFHVGDTWMEPADGCRMEDLRVADHPGMHRYTATQGWPPLIDAIVERVRRRHGVATERDQVLVTGGATLGLGVVVGAVVKPGEEVLIAAPYWPLIAGIVRTFHGVPVAVPFYGDVQSAEEAVAALERHRTERTAAVYWNTPNNPTGRLIPADWLAAMVEWARDNKLWIVADEVYEEYLFDGGSAAHTPTRPLAPERTFSCHSFSKAYGMAGNRAGYVVAPAETMPVLRKIGTHTVFSTPTASQIAAQRVLTGPGDAWVATALTLYSEIGAWAADRLGVRRPDGSTFLFLDLTERLDGRGLQGFLEDVAEQGVLLAPGPSFGPYPRHARLCYTATSPEVTRRGVEALARLLGR